MWCDVVCIYLLAIVEQALANLDGEAGGAIEAVPRGVRGWTHVRVECDVWTLGRRRRTRLRRRPARARLYTIHKQTISNNIHTNTTLSNNIHIPANK